MMLYHATFYCPEDRVGYYIARLKEEFRSEIVKIESEKLRGHKNLKILRVYSDYCKAPERFNIYYAGLVRDMNRLMGDGL